MVLLHLIAYMLLPIVGIGFGYVITNLAQLSLGTDAFPWQARWCCRAR